MRMIGGEQRLGDWRIQHGRVEQGIAIHPRPSLSFARFIPNLAPSRRATLRAKMTRRWRECRWPPAARWRRPRPACRRSSGASRGRTTPMQDAARSIVSGLTTPTRLGVSPPPQVTLQRSQARFPALRLDPLARCLSSNQALEPAAQYACTDHRRRADGDDVVDRHRQGVLGHARRNRFLAGDRCRIASAISTLVPRHSVMEASKHVAEVDHVLLTRRGSRRSR